MCRKPTGRSDVMASTTSIDERTAIEAVVQLYIDGASKGDAAKLKEAFQEKGWMFGSVEGHRSRQ
jgi:putative lumazine-binding protein